jgi:hypothetical protein
MNSCDDTRVPFPATAAGQTSAFLNALYGRSMKGQDQRRASRSAESAMSPVRDISASPRNCWQVNARLNGRGAKNLLSR